MADSLFLDENVQTEAVSINLHDIMFYLKQFSPCFWA
jgi:hypothetical protein